jgi:predicted RNA-binding protein (virulence factor B family)
MELGKYNKLKTVRAVDFGLYLDGDDGKEILLPTRYVPQNAKVGDEIEVFVYNDNEGRPIATTDKPFGIVGEFCMLKVKDKTPAGVFLEWGVMKDLLVPFSEQKEDMKTGKYYLVYIYLDYVTKRIAASTRLDKFLDNIPPEYEQNQEVDLTVAGKTELGYKVIVNNLHWGLIYRNQVFKELHIGEKCKGYIKEVRQDDKIDVCLYPAGYEKVTSVVHQIVRKLDNNQGFLPYNDKTDAEIIYSVFACSKKCFKQAIGYLYRMRVIKIESKGIIYIEKH